MRDEFNRINADAHNITDLLSWNFFRGFDADDESRIRWYLHELNRYHTNIGEALGRIEKQLHNTGNVGTSNVREGTIRSENADEKGSVSTEENSSSSERDELLRGQQPDDSAQRSSDIDGRPSTEKERMETSTKRESVKSDPDLSY